MVGCRFFLLSGMFFIITISLYADTFSEKPLFAITCDFSGSSRLGDKIVVYCKAKWLAHKFKLPFLAQPFPYSDCFYFDKLETKIQISDINNLFKNRIDVETDDDLALKLKTQTTNTLFQVKLMTGIVDKGLLLNQRDVHSRGLYYLLFSCDCLYLLATHDNVFREEIKKNIRPIVSVASFSLPQDRITVAVHVRKGGGYDPDLSSKQYFELTDYNVINVTHMQQKQISEETSTQGIDNRFPIIFPPEQFYVEQIVKLSNLLKDAPLFVYVFTDDKEPQALVNRLKDRVKKDNIIYETRTTENFHDKNVIDDMFFMAQFDCLIRGASHFSWVSQMIGNHKIIMSAQHATWITDKKLLIDRVNVFFRPPTLDDPKIKLFEPLLLANTEIR